MPFGRKSPLEALALPGVMLAYKYSQFRQRRREAASRRVTERELSALHHKIDKLLSKLEENEPEPPTSREDECVICINARATMQTSPCGHRVVCRRCFVKTIQTAVAQRLLPLRCVICRARVNRLTSSSGTWRIQESASSYSMGAKSWASAGVGAGGASAGGVHASASSYSMGDAHSMGLSPAAFRPAAASSAPSSARYPRSPNGRVAQSSSLYSMSSGSSTMSSVSNATNFSKTSSISSGGLYSPVAPSSPISPSGFSYASSSLSILNNHLAPPGTGNAGGGGSHSSCGSLSPISGGSLSPRDLHHHHHHHHQQHHPHHQQQQQQHQHHHHQHQLQNQLHHQPQQQHLQTHSHRAGCPAGCSGAVPRKPLQSLSSSSSSSSNGSCGGVDAERRGTTDADGCDGDGGRCNAGCPAFFSSTTHTYPGRRHTKGRLMDLQNRLPPIKEFRSPAKVPHPSPVHISNPRFRYSTYTKSAKNPHHEMLPLLYEPPSPPRRPLNIQVSASLTTLGPTKTGSGGGEGAGITSIGGGLSAKISPLTAKNALPKNAYTMPKEKKGIYNNNGTSNNNANSNNNSNTNTNKSYSNNNINSNNHSIVNGKSSNTSNMYKHNINSNNKNINTINQHSAQINQSNSSTNNINNSNNKSNNNAKKFLQDLNLKSSTLVKFTGAITGSNSGPNTGDSLNSTTTNSKNHHLHNHHNHHQQRTSASNRSFPLFSYSSNNKEKSDNKKNESVERKKKEEKLKLKAEKEARKEEKRLAKEEERLAKLIAKEEKKKIKKEAKELLIANDGNNKK